MKTSELAQLFKEKPHYDYELAGELFESDRPRIEVSLRLFRVIGCAQAGAKIHILVDHRDGYVLVQDKPVKGSELLVFDHFSYLSTWFTLLGEVAPPLPGPSDTRFG